MPFAIRPNRFNWNYSSSAPATSYGVSVIPGASNVEGAWTQIASAAQITDAVWEFELYVGGGNTTTESKEHLLDVGVDPAGGAAYSAVISNLACGQAAALTTGGGRRWRFPLEILSGSSVAVRIQGANATAGTVRVAGIFYGRPSAPELIKCGSFAETIGAITNSSGVSFTPGNGADGAWTLLGVTTNHLWWWQIGVQCDNAAVAANIATSIDLAYGDATNKTIIIEDLVTLQTTAELFHSPQAQNCNCSVPAGTNIYIRSRASGAPDTGWNAVAVGIGGDA